MIGALEYSLKSDNLSDVIQQICRMISLVRISLLKCYEPYGAQGGSSLCCILMQFFGFPVFMLLTALAMQVPVRKKVQELTFEELFLSKLQRHLHNGDMEGALEAVHQHEIASVVYPGELERKEKLGKHHEDEKMTDEAYRLPTFQTLKDAKDAFMDTPEARKRKEAVQAKLRGRLESLKAQRLQIRDMVKQVEAMEPTPKHTTILSELRKLSANIKSTQNTTIEQLIESIQDSMKRTKFIEDHPKMFLEKKYFANDQFGLKRAKDRMKWLGDGQVVLVDDKFSKTMPESLKLKCVNSNQFTNLPETRTERHGVAVASVVVDAKIGVAPNAKFRAGNFVTDHFPKVLGPFMERPSDAPLIPIEGDSLGEFEIRALAICLRGETRRFACLVGGEYYTIDTSLVKPFPELVINISTNFWDDIDRDRNENPKRRLVYLLAFGSIIHSWIKQGKIIVWAAGNEGTTVGASSAYTILRFFPKVYPKAFLVALALEDDHTSLSDFTNQPGDHPIKGVSLCAPGENVDTLNIDGTYNKTSGTSFSAPFIAGAAALLASNYPKATGPQIISALLDSATPVVMRKSPNRLYESPYALRDVRSKYLIPGEHVYLKADGKRPGKIIVTKEMIQKGREKYGVGIINVSGAMKALEKM